MQPRNASAGVLRRYALIVSKRLFFLICGPNLNSTHGIGNMVNDKNPSRLVAHAIPNPSYTERIELARLPFARILMRQDLLWTVKRGKAAPAIYLTRPLAANAEAPFSGPYTSTRYRAAEVKTQMLPQAKGTVASTGLIQ